MAKETAYERLYREVMEDQKNQTKAPVKMNYNQRYKYTMNTIAQKYEEETLKQLDSIERTGKARPDVRKALHDVMYNKDGSRRRNFATIQQDIAKVERVKSLPGPSSVVAVRNFKSNSNDFYYSPDMPTLYVKKEPNESDSMALYRETAKQFREYQKELIAYKAKHGSYQGFPRGTGSGLPQHLLRLSNRFPEAFTISDTNDIIGSFEIHEDKLAQYEGDPGFDLMSSSVLEVAGITPTGMEARRIGMAASQARLVARYPNVGQVVTQFTAAGVNLEKLRDILNSNIMSGYFMGYLGYESDQYKRARVKCRQRVMTEAEFPSTEEDDDGETVYKFSPIDAGALAEFVVLVRACDADWDDSDAGAKLQEWFEKHVGDAYF